MADPVVSWKDYWKYSLLYLRFDNQLQKGVYAVQDVHDSVFFGVVNSTNHLHGCIDTRCPHLSWVLNTFPSLPPVVIVPLRDVISDIYNVLPQIIIESPYAGSLELPKALLFSHTSGPSISQHMVEHLEELESIVEFNRLVALVYLFLRNGELSEVSPIPKMPYYEEEAEQLVFQIFPIPISETGSAQTADIILNFLMNSINRLALKFLPNSVLLDGWPLLVQKITVLQLWMYWSSKISSQKLKLFMSRLLEQLKARVAQLRMDVDDSKKLHFFNQGIKLIEEQHIFDQKTLISKTYPKLLEKLHISFNVSDTRKKSSSFEISKLNGSTIDDFFIYLIEANLERPVYPLPIKRAHELFYIPTFEEYPALSFVLERLSYSKDRYFTYEEVMRHHRFFNWLAGEPIKSRWKSPKRTFHDYGFESGTVIVQWDVDIYKNPETWMVAKMDIKLLSFPLKSLDRIKAIPFDYTLCKVENNSIEPLSVIPPVKVVDYIKNGYHVYSDILPWEVLSSGILFGHHDSDVLHKAIQLCKDRNFIPGSTELKTHLLRLI